MAFGVEICDVVLVIFLGLCWVGVLTSVVLDFTGIRRRGGTWWRWQGTGLLLLNGAILASAFARYRQWPDPRQVGLLSVTVVLLLSFSL